jgi:hypothetical protein
VRLIELGVGGRGRLRGKTAGKALPSCLRSSHLQRLHTIWCESRGGAGFVGIASMRLRGSGANGIVDMAGGGDRNGLLQSVTIGNERCVGGNTSRQASALGIVLIQLLSA